MDSSPPAPLHARITAYVHARTEAVVARFLPNFQIPAFFAGHRTTYMDFTEVAWLLVHLREFGINTVGGRTVEDAVAALLRKVDGPATNTFYSFRVAESLGEFGAFEGNPILRDYSGAERENLRQAVDSSSLYDPETGTLRGYNNNYWAVLARCEWGRKQLGVLPDDTLFETCLTKVRELLFKNTRGFFDDSPDLSGRYDLYTADTHLFLEPLWPLLDAERLRQNLLAHVRLLEAIALENGAFVAWGRSIGPLSVCMTAELGSTALRLGLASDPGRMAALVERAFEAFQGWIEDDLIRAHRGPMTEGYRGVQRLLQMTLDCLSKLCYAARQLSLASDDMAPRAEGLFPPTDELIPLDDARPASVWTFRNERLAFQLPLVSGTNADYVPWFHAPDLFENPVESTHVCGVPRVVIGDGEYACAGLPVEVEKLERGLRLRYEGFQSTGGTRTDAPLAGSRAVEFRVDGDCITAEETWTFAQTPDAISFQIPEAARVLSLQLEGADARVSTVNVEGMSGWRSCWGPLRRVHQADFTPARALRFTWRLRPALRVVAVHCESDYHRAAYDAMPPGELDEHGLRSGQIPWQQGPEATLADADVFHLGWPEHLFHAHGRSETQLVERNEEFIARLKQTPVRVVWTMHNRRPHNSLWRGEAGTRLYEAWARASDAVIHHSTWGMELMRAELPFRPDARHAVIPHGHFGASMPPPASREELERRFGLAPCALRFGVLGRPQTEKQTDLIVRAFMAAARPDQQFVVSAHPIETDVSGDGRVTLLPREPWMTREAIAAHLYLCDALVSARTGETYLTSGVIGDAIGVGIPMVVNAWPFFRETFGDAAFYYDDSEEGLTRLLAGIGADEVARAKDAVTAMQQRYSWPVLARQTLEFMRSLSK